MTVVDPKLVPKIPVGRLFDKMADDQPRWIVPNDVVMADVSNRPLADMYVHLLSLAKAVDELAPDSARMKWLVDNLEPSDVGLDGDDLRGAIDAQLERLRNPYGRVLDI